jgi:hypothetical protein
MRYKHENFTKMILKDGFISLLFKIQSHTSYCLLLTLKTKNVSLHNELTEVNKFICMHTQACTELFHLRRVTVASQDAAELVSVVSTS